MNVEPVQTAEDFQLFVDDLVNTLARTSQRNLDEYLRALWGLLVSQQDKEPTWQLLAQLFRRAFIEPAYEFDHNWLQYTDPDTEFYQTTRSEFDVLKQMLLYQIADLHRMRASGNFDLPGYILSGGISSPTGHIWYNFSPEDFLASANSGIQFRADHCTWSDLALFLWLGQIYE